MNKFHAQSSAERVGDNDAFYLATRGGGRRRLSSPRGVEDARDARWEVRDSPEERGTRSGPRDTPSCVDTASLADLVRER